MDQELLSFSPAIGTLAGTASVTMLFFQKTHMEHWTDPNPADRHILISGLDGNPKRRLGFSAVFCILIYWIKLKVNQSALLVSKLGV